MKPNGKDSAIRSKLPEPKYQPNSVETISTNVTLPLMIDAESRRLRHKPISLRRKARQR